MFAPESSLARSTHVIPGRTLTLVMGPAGQRGPAPYMWPRSITHPGYWTPQMFQSLTIWAIFGWGNVDHKHQSKLSRFWLLLSFIHVDSPLKNFCHFFAYFNTHINTSKTIHYYHQFHLLKSWRQNQKSNRSGTYFFRVHIEAVRSI